MQKRIARIRRHKKIRKRIKGTAKRPRLDVFRSNKHIYVQLIDDVSGKTLVCADDSKLDDKLTKEKKKVEVAEEVGKLIAKKALDNKIDNIVFDRGGYKYAGRVMAVAKGARVSGLKF